MSAYYNEIDAFAANWLRCLIACDLIAPGDVDERSIEDVTPDDLRPYTQCHFFAGIGVWSYALRRIGWPDDARIWTGSCPCQPFSAAGKGGGFTDERHLWPSWFHLISQCEPIRIVGEQVSAKAVDAWIDLVHADLEGMGYAFGCLPFPSASVGAPHIRDRCYWVADADEGRSGRHGGTIFSAQSETERRVRGVANGIELGSTARGVEHTASDGREQGRTESSGRGAESRCGADGVTVGDANYTRPQGRSVSRTNSERLGTDSVAVGAAGSFDGVDHAAGERYERIEGGRRQTLDWTEQPSATNGFWRDADWLPCIDGKARPVEPGTFPLVNGAPARVGRLRGYGNAINAEQAATFLEAALA